MTLPNPTRRAVVGAGGLAAALGVFGGTWALANGSDDRPGAWILTSGSVPSSIDRLVHVRVDDLQTDDIARAGALTLLDSPAFADVPDAITSFIDRETVTDIEADGLAKLVLVGDDDGAAALAWVTWSEADLLAELESIADETAEMVTDGDSPIRVVGEAAVASITENLFVLGERETATSVAAVWNDKSDPLAGPLLDAFTAATREAPVRFAVERPVRNCRDTVGGEETANRIGYVSGDAFAEGDVHVSTVTFRSDEFDDAEAVEEDVVSSLGFGGRDDLPADDIFTHDGMRHVSLDRDGTRVMLNYRAPADEPTDVIDALFAAIGCGYGT
ncbi:hypothetical protein [Halostagnicola bangensis]